MKLGFHPPEIRAINLDSDWVYRKYLPSIMLRIINRLGSVNESTRSGLENKISSGEQILLNIFGPTANFARVFTNGVMILWIAVIFTGALAIVLF